MGFSFFPKEKKFFVLMAVMGEEVLDSAQAFSDFARAKSENDRSSAKARIEDVRERSKATSSKITEELCRSFITPFDREDIQDLANLFYKIPKIINKTTERITMHGMEVGCDDFSYQADLILREAQATRVLLQALISGKGNAPVLEQASILKDLENEGDQIRNRLIVSLFQSDRDIKDIILRRDIYDMLEKVVDRFRDIAGVALQIVLKHS